MKITVFGAEGEIGQKVISYALSRGSICDCLYLRCGNFMAQKKSDGD